ncbi:hypothetical protein SISSUDRAFT_1132558 [Sistotremastrum suecicum HHB10207 ss-3]|uniref:F-box domain-containing protein n=1 Tax=Sistotremastrum suecicum HHB10207 ss-3 TaxID=1314776 RepID=A0A165YNM4_9AGAM|nr:hypothetical protein SISSUDRAFT_1132558 [Sistotremastrum suecicum HHB10207 ss-3]
MEPDNWYELKDFNKERTILMGVCKSWRDVVLDSPSLWSQFNLRMTRHEQQRYMQRVGGAFLDLYKNYSPKPEAGRSPLPDCLPHEECQGVAKSKARVRSLNVVPLYFEDSDIDMDVPVSVLFPQLTHLIFTDPPDADSPYYEYPPSWALFSPPYPPLTHLSFTYLCHLRDWDKLQSLREVAYSGKIYTDLLEALASLRALESLSLIGRCLNPQDSKMHPATLRSVRRLILQPQDDSTVGDLGLSMNLPSLTHLIGVIESRIFSESDYWEPFNRHSDFDRIVRLSSLLHLRLHPGFFALTISSLNESSNFFKAKIVLSCPSGTECTTSADGERMDCDKCLCDLQNCVYSIRTLVTGCVNLTTVIIRADVAWEKRSDFLRCTFERLTVKGDQIDLPLLRVLEIQDCDILGEWIKPVVCSRLEAGIGLDSLVLDNVKVEPSDFDPASLNPFVRVLYRP